MRVVLYTRVSKDSQQRGKSVQQQEDEARLACAALGWEIVEVFSDNHRSASRYARREREGYTELRTYLAEQAVDAVVVWEASRGSRELEDWAGLLNLCRRRGVRIHVVADERTYDLDRPNDWKALADAGVDSEHESNKIRMRILRDVRANAMKGRPHGRLPYGYTRRYGETGELIEQAEKPEQAAILRELARRALAGESLYGIAADLRARQVEPPGRKNRRWEPEEVKRLLVSPTYAGIRVLRKEAVGEAGAAAWPAIFTEDEHRRLRALLLDPARNTVTDSTLRHLLSGLITSGECGSNRVTPATNHGYPTYQCRRDFCIAVRVPALDEFVTDVLVARLKRPDARRFFAPQSNDGALKAAEDELEKLEAQRADYVRLQLAGQLSLDTLVQAEASLRPLIADAKRRATPPKPASPALRRLTEPGADVEGVWQAMTIFERREVIQATMHIVVVRGRRGARSLDPARLGLSSWIGSSTTWAEDWAAG